MQISLLDRVDDAFSLLTVVDLYCTRSRKERLDLRINVHYWTEKIPVIERLLQDSDRWRSLYFLDCTSSGNHLGFLFQNHISSVEKISVERRSFNPVIGINMDFWNTRKFTLLKRRRRNSLPRTN
ncbi:hypothetical protein BT96DRAFT_440869 [Gymnopus androsaceus JB14]|uniref:Uncharacterized protein n=1 Tax=Gymnopus androsaceus JB14 TaxID=1447944 RepID=A0A6A4I4U3_9AGAR|nr:hypothetical protein BT96DRAFT_440869 [Gymnopus androsaceus JB14]